MATCRKLSLDVAGVNCAGALRPGEVRGELGSTRGCGMPSSALRDSCLVLIGLKPTAQSQSLTPPTLVQAL